MKKPHVLHDLKNERADLAPPLPAFLALLPFLFYGAVVGSVGLSAMSVLATKQAIAAGETALAREQEEQEREQSTDRFRPPSRARRAARQRPSVLA